MGSDRVRKYEALERRVRALERRFEWQSGAEVNWSERDAFQHLLALAQGELQVDSFTRREANQMMRRIIVYEKTLSQIAEREHTDQYHDRNGDAAKLALQGFLPEKLPIGDSNVTDWEYDPEVYRKRFKDTAD